MAKRILRDRAAILKKLSAKPGRLTAAQARRLNGNFLIWLRHLAWAIGPQAIVEQLNSRKEHQAFQAAVTELTNGQNGPEVVYLAFTAGERYAELQLAIAAEKGRRATERADKITAKRIEDAADRHGELIRFAKSILPKHRGKNGRIYKEEIYKQAADHFRISERTASNILRPLFRNKSIS